jgi:hypothetical protein
MAAERFDGRLSVFDLDGEFARLVPGRDLSGDSVFALDSWLYRRFWVMGALAADVRREVRTVLDRLPLPSEAPGYRVVVRGDDGTLWIEEPGRVEGETRWTRIGRDASPSGVLSIPVRFTPTHFRANEVLGVWRGEADVHFVRAYPIEAGPGETVAPPAWLTRNDGASPAQEAPEMEEVMSLIRSSIRSIASAQEVYYSSHMSYTDRVDSLSSLEAPVDLWIDIIDGTPRGWSGVFAHPGVDRICGLAYGFGIPAGWTPGMVACAPEEEGGVRPD